MSNRPPFFHGGSNGRDSFGAPANLFLAHQAYEGLQQLATIHGSEIAGGVACVMPLDLTDKQVRLYGNDLLCNSGWLDDPNSLSDTWATLSTMTVSSSEMGYRMAAMELYLGGVACLQSEDANIPPQDWAMGIGYRYDLDLNPPEADHQQPRPYMLRSYQTLQAPKDTSRRQMRKTLANLLCKRPSASQHDFATASQAVSLRSLSALLIEQPPA